ncbi:MAG: flagellar hook-basal body complex protein, partial [bacterium]
RRDLAIEGEGFFALKSDEGLRFTRTGAFDLDARGNVVSRLNGGVLQSVDPEKSASELKNMKIDDSDQSLSPRASDSMKLSGNLPADLPDREEVSVSVDLYNSRGGTETVRLDFSRTGHGEFSLEAVDSKTDETALKANLEFDSQGNLSLSEVENSPNSPEGFNGLYLTSEGGAEPVKIEAGNIDFSNLTAQAGENSVEVTEISGYQSGDLEGIRFSENGELIGSYSNGEQRSFGRVAVARFENPAGLQSSGEGLYSQSANSGLMRTAGAGRVRPGFLEMSNVDPASELLEQLGSKHALQASISALKTSDEMLGELLDMNG